MWVASVTVVPRLEYPTYLDHIRTESARFREVLADCDPSARVPTCPDWDAADLLWHLAKVQLFWAKVIRHRPASPDDPEIGEEDAAQRPESYAELLDAFDDYSHALATELERADPEAEAWHWSGDSRVGTSYRRQAHEAAIHRIDAELTAGVPVTPLDAALADDGVAEALGVMYGGAPPWGSFTPSGETIAVRMTDTGTDLLVALGKFSGTDPETARPTRTRTTSRSSTTGRRARRHRHRHRRRPRHLALEARPGADAWARTRATGSGSRVTGSPTRSCRRSWASRSTDLPAR